jgi:hypothetical protein
MSDDIAGLGPLAVLAGVWEGDKGDDKAPDDDRTQVGQTPFRERITLEPIGAVNNHEQILYGLRYSTVAWPIGEEGAFHEEVGYWLWDAANKQVIRSFIVPRGVSVQAGGTAEADATKFSMAADAGSETYGICSNLFLQEEFRTVHYEVEIEIHDNDTFSYAEDTVLEIKGQSELFHHRDANTLRRVG